MHLKRENIEDAIVSNKWRKFLEQIYLVCVEEEK